MKKKKNNNQEPLTLSDDTSDRDRKWKMILVILKREKLAKPQELKILVDLIR